MHLEVGLLTLSKVVCALKRVVTELDCELDMFLLRAGVPFSLDGLFGRTEDACPLVFPLAVG